MVFTLFMVLVLKSLETTNGNSSLVPLLWVEKADRIFQVGLNRIESNSFLCLHLVSHSWFILAISTQVNGILGEHQIIAKMNSLTQ